MHNPGIKIVVVTARWGIKLAKRLNCLPVSPESDKDDTWYGPYQEGSFVFDRGFAIPGKVRRKWEG